MIEIEAMTDNEVMQELWALQGDFTEQDFDQLECNLVIRAGCLGWTGDPMQQPPRSVLASAREVIAKRSAVA